jgi:hypothetical protein
LATGEGLLVLLQRLNDYPIGQRLDVQFHFTTSLDYVECC